MCGATSGIQTQIGNCAPEVSPTFTGTVSIPGAPSTGVINFRTTMALGADLSSAKILLWPTLFPSSSDRK